MRKRRTFVRRFLRCIFHQHILVPVVGLEPTRYRYQRILSYLLHTEYKRTQPPMEAVDGHQKALNY